LSGERKKEKKSCNSYAENIRHHHGKPNCLGFVHHCSRFHWVAIHLNTKATKILSGGNEGKH
jgi:hypothetical protein